MWKSPLKPLLTLLCLQCTLSLPAQTALPPLSIFWQHPALAQRLEGPVAALAAEHRYGLRETSRFTLAAALPSGSGGWALSAGRWGTAQYAEEEISLAYGRLLWAGGAVGLRVQGVRAGERRQLRVQGGLLLQAGAGVTLALSAGGAAAGGMGEEGPPDRLEAAFGIWWVPSPELSLGAGMGASERGGPEVEGGAVYAVHPRVRLRFSMSSSGVVVGGAGMRFGSWWLEPGTSVHPVLGASPQLLLLLQMPGK